MIDPHHLPDDQKVLKEMIVALLNRVQEGERKLAQTNHLLEQLLRAKYGPKGERLDPDQMALFDAPKEEPEAAPAAEAEAVASLDTPKDDAKTKGHGRRQQPAEMERRRVEYDLAEHERNCPHCQAAMRRIGEDTSETLEFIPASVVVIEHIQAKYACAHGCTIRTAAKPAQPVDRGLAGPGLLAHVVVNKFADHLPLHRQEGILARYGIELSRQTMCDWMRSAAGLLEPLWMRMKGKVLESAVIQTDDTPVAVLDRKLSKTRTGRTWTYLGDRTRPYTVYDYTPTRKRDGPQQFLGEYDGFLQADAYAGYDCLYGPQRATEVACWAHSRRKFFEARTTDAARAYRVLAMIQILYRIERAARKAELKPSGVRKLRQRQAAPIVAALGDYLRQEADKVLPKSPIAQAIGYALNHWGALNVYLSDGRLNIDNNASERSLRGVAVGRRNWMFFGSDRGGKTAAVLLSIVETCRRHRIDPFAYLRDIFRRIAGHPINRIDELLPGNWAPLPA